MALHGKIMLNDEVLGAWEAVRDTPKPVKGVNLYHVRVDYTAKGHPPMTFRCRMRHDYDDGALALAARVLSWADKQLPSKP